MNKAKNEVLLENALKLADHHRKHCDGPECEISLHMLLELLRLAGIEVPRELLGRFI